MIRAADTAQQRLGPDNGGVVAVADLADKAAPDTVQFAEGAIEGLDGVIRGLADVRLRFRVVAQPGRRRARRGDRGARTAEW